MVHVLPVFINQRSLEFSNLRFIAIPLLCKPQLSAIAALGTVKPTGCKTLSGTWKKTPVTQDPVHCSIYQSGALPGSYCGSLWSGRMNEFMNDSWFWKQGRLVFTTHLKAITSQPCRNDHGCWFCHTDTEVRQLKSQSSKHPCGFRTEGSSKTMIGSDHQQPTHIATKTLLGNLKHTQAHQSLKAQVTVYLETEKENVSWPIYLPPSKSWQWFRGWGYSEKLNGNTKIHTHSSSQIAHSKNMHVLLPQISGQQKLSVHKPYSDEKHY